MKHILLSMLALSALAMLSCKKKDGPVVPLPAYSVPNMNGGTCTPKDIEGKKAIVEIWSLRCPHCRHQAKYLEELAKDLDFSKYAIVSIHAMGGEAKKDEVAKHFKNKKIQVCLDNGSFIKSLRTLPRKYQVRGIPHLFMVKANGEISEVLRGARPAATLKEKLEALK